MHLLLSQTQTDLHPADFVQRIGSVFAEFGILTQDSGNISYGVEADGQRFFVKTAGDPSDNRPSFGHTVRVGMLRNAVCLARSCSHSALPQLHQVIESPTGPMLVYDWIDGELLRPQNMSRNDPQSPFQRFRRLPADRIVECLDVIYDMHCNLARLGWIANDFYDGSILYNFQTGRVGIIDLDHYHKGPFRNEMGRMFGSSSFMAPEEFELGATIDEQTTVFTLGRAAAMLLSDGTLALESFRGSEALHSVVVKACQPERDQRFASVQEFIKAWNNSRYDDRQN